MNETINKLVTDITTCIKTIVTDVEAVPTTKDGKDVKCKLVEVKNRSGVDIFVRPNRSDEFPLNNGEDRVIMIKKLSDIQLKRQSGTAEVIVHIIIEN